MAVRDCSVGDMASVSAIYAHYVTDSIITFEETPPSLEEMQERWNAITKQGFPFLVACDGDTVIGYAYANLFRSRSAYRYSAEHSIYVHKDCASRGTGSILMEKLLTKLKERGTQTVVGILATKADNPLSYALHTKFGFRQVAHYE